MIPVTVDDLAANGLLGEDYPEVCWMRAVETLTARKGDIAGLAVASDERIEACILYIKEAVDQEAAAEADIMSVKTFIEDGGARLRHLRHSTVGARAEDLALPEGPPCGDLEGVATDPRFPPRRRASPLRREGTIRVVAQL